MKTLLIALIVSAFSLPVDAADLSKGLPDGGKAEIGSGDIRGAWYVGPTDRYAHAVLGDAIEAAGLRAKTVDGKVLTFELPENAVFEDITPRIVDLNGDHRNEIVTIKSTQSGGGAIAVFGIRSGKLQEIAANPPIGLRNRWLNPAGIADFDGDGTLEIATVRTPHIGGTLQFWSLDGSKMVLEADQFGFSNHAIGSRALGLSATVDVNGDGVVDLVLPDAARRTIKAVSLVEGRIIERGSIALPGGVSGDFRLKSTQPVKIEVPVSGGHVVIRFP